MLILKDKQALLFKLKEPSRITTVIPTSKKVQHNGEILVAVPHRPDEVRVLKNLGIKAPSPFPYYYQWLGGRTPFAAQVETASFLSMNSRAFCLNSFGTGKTYTALAAYDYLRSLKQAKKVLVVAPLSTLDLAWANEVFRNFPHLEAAVLYGTKEKRLKLLASDADIYIINADGLGTIKDALKGRSDIDFVIVDELAMYRTAATERWKRLNEICNKQCDRRVWGMTGAPIPNEPTDAYAQIKLVTPSNSELPRYFGHFRDLVMNRLSQFKWVPKHDALETVRRIMQPAIRFTLDDCVDLPPIIGPIEREVPLSPEQKKAYNTMLEKFKLEYDGGQVLAANEAVKVGKLIQIACGVAYGKDGEDVFIPSQPRIDELLELIEESEGKTIIFVPLTGALKHVYSMVSTKYTAAMVYGATKKSDRDEIFAAFQKSSNLRVLVANPGTMSHGLTLTEASSIVWFAPTTSNEIYEQANGRTRRPGQKRSTVITHISGTAAERKQYKQLATKGERQSVLLELFEELDE